MNIFKKMALAVFIFGATFFGNYSYADETKINSHSIEDIIIVLERNLVESLVESNILVNGLSKEQEDLINIINTLKKALPNLEKVDLKQKEIVSVEKEDSKKIEVKNKKINSNITTRTLSSSNISKNDIASFRFLAPIKPFGNPIYIPVVGLEAVNIEIINAATNNEISTTPTISVVSLADRVDGNDGNEYFKVSNEKTFSISVTVQPGAGDYYAELNGIRFTNQNVADLGFSSFSGLNIPFGNSWQSDTLTLSN